MEFLIICFQYVLLLSSILIMPLGHQVSNMLFSSFSPCSVHFGGPV